MIDFSNATDAELAVVCKFVDSVTIIYPDALFEDSDWLNFVHYLKNEIVARGYQEYAKIISNQNCLTKNQEVTQ